MALRYLAAFGPASVRDLQTWSGLNRLAEVLERLRPRLRGFRPDADSPAPPRFLPEFDNALLSHADRTRIVSDDDRRRFISRSGAGLGSILVEGFVRGTWKIARVRGGAALLVHPFRPLSNADRTAVAEEGARLLAFAATGAGAHEMRFKQAD
jgi:Winged helix DNA-binding domain